MELADILLLVKAGYSREEITAMDTPTTATANPEPVPATVDVPVQDAKPAEQTAQVVEPVATPTPTPQAVPQPTPEQPSMADIMQSIAKLTSAVQANAIAQSVIPQGLSTPPKAEDMIAEIIRPTFRERS